GDMACHILGAPNMALKLGAPTSVECIKKEGVSDFMFPKSSTIKFEFPARGSMPPVTLYWYDGMKENPKIEGVPEGELIGDIPNPRVGGGRGAGRGAGAHPLSGALPRLDSRLQRWRSVLLELLCRRPVHRMDRDGGDFAPRGRQAGVGSHQNAVHQQQRSQ